MQQDVARCLLFSAQQQQQQQDAGLSAQLHALRLRCSLQAEKCQSPNTALPLLSEISNQCSVLLASNSQQVMEGRYGSCQASGQPMSLSCRAHIFDLLGFSLSRASRCAAAAAATGNAPLQLPQGVDLVSSI